MKWMFYDNVKINILNPMLAVLGAGFLATMIVFAIGKSLVFFNEPSMTVTAQIICFLICFFWIDIRIQFNVLTRDIVDHIYDVDRLEHISEYEEM